MCLDEVYQVTGVIYHALQCCESPGLRSGQERSRILRCGFIHVSGQRQMYHPLFLPGQEGTKIVSHYPPPPPAYTSTVVPTILCFFVSSPFYSQHKNTLSSPQEGRAGCEQRFGEHIML